MEKFDLENVKQESVVKRQKLKKPEKVTLNSLKTKTTGLQKTMLLADISGSMGGNKLFELKKALSSVWQAGISCIGFESEIWQIDQSDIAHLDNMGSTHMLAGLEEAWTTKPHHMVLMTDGHPTDANEDDILARVRVHKDIPIDTVGIGDKGSVRSYRPEFLRQISDITGGRFFDIGDPIKLTSTLQHLIEYRPNKLRQGSQESEKGDVIQL